jgi:hypothetical protein
MITKSKIDLIRIDKFIDNNSYNNSYNNSHNNSYNNSYLDDTFLELLFIQKKFKLVELILNNDNICKRYLRVNLVNYIIFLCCVFENVELFFTIVQNYSHCINGETFFSTKFYLNNQSCLMYLISNKTDETDKILDWIMEKYFTCNKSISCCIIDTNGNSLITWLIKHNHNKYLEKIINVLGADIFKHIPTYVLNSKNLSYSTQLSNGQELYWACKKNLGNIAQFFVSNKLGSINYFDSEGNSTLMFACKNNMDTIAYTLLNTGLVDCKRKNLLGKTALDYAKQNNMEQICQIIQEKLKPTLNSNSQIFAQYFYNCEKNKNIK